MNYRKYYRKIVESVSMNDNRHAQLITDAMASIVNSTGMRNYAMICPKDNMYSLAITDLKVDDNTVSYNIYGVDDKGIIDRNDLVDSVTTTLGEFLKSTFWSIDPEELAAEISSEYGEDVSSDEIEKLVNITESMKDTSDKVSVSEESSVNESDVSLSSGSTIKGSEITEELLPRLLNMYDEDEASIYFKEGTPQAWDAVMEVQGDYVIVSGYYTGGGYDPKSVVNMKVRIDTFIKSIEEVYID